MQHPTQESERLAAFTTFMRTYQNMVYSTAARLSGKDIQAEDITQEVFLRAHRHFDELRDNPRAAGWLKTVATNLTFTHLTRYRKRWVLFSQLPGAESEDNDATLDVPSDESVADAVSTTDRNHHIEAALHELPEHQRVPLVLFHFEELPYEQIAQKLRVSLPKVKTDIHRARQALEKLLARRGITADQLDV